MHSLSIKSELIVQLFKYIEKALINFPYNILIEGKKSND